MDDEDLNMILARSDAELEVFRQMDEQRAKDLTYGTAPGSKRIPRLMAESELPEIYMSDGNPISDEPEEIKGRGARERTRVKYDDGLTEEQWLNAVDDDEDSPEAAAARKQARKDRREQNRLKRAGQIPGSIENSPAGSRESTEEPEPEPTPKKGRGRGKVVKADKRKAEEVDDEPPPKRKRGPVGRPSKVSSANGDGMSAKHRNVLQNSLTKVYEFLMDLEEPDSSDSDDEAPRLIIGPFVALPPKRDYPDYYMLIQEPISMKMIEKKIKKQEYNSLADLKRDIHQLCKNAKTYNEDGSVIYLDAVKIQNNCDTRIREEIAEHPELGDSDDFSRNGGSTAPTTNAGTPLPVSTSTGKIKLTFNNSQYANGGSSGIQSDDDDD